MYKGNTFIEEENLTSCCVVGLFSLYLSPADLEALRVNNKEQSILQIISMH
jgi:hypothetical protein